MGFLSTLGALLKGLLAILGLIRSKQDRDIGAALQRGEDEHAELDRIVRANEAGNDWGLPDANRVLNDKNDRDNQPFQAAGVQRVAGAKLQHKRGQRPNRPRSKKA